MSIHPRINKWMHASHHWNLCQPEKCVHLGHFVTYHHQPVTVFLTESDEKLVISFFCSRVFAHNSNIFHQSNCYLSNIYFSSIKLLSKQEFVLSPLLFNKVHYRHQTKKIIAFEIFFCSGLDAHSSASS